MDNAVWDALPAEVQSEVDSLLLRGRRVNAIKVIRDAMGTAAPGIPTCLDLIVERYEALGCSLRGV